MRSVDSLLVTKGMGRGGSWWSLDLETLERDVSSGKSAGAITKDRGCQAAVFVNVLRSSSEEIQLHVMSVVLKGVASLCLEPVHERLSVCCACVHW